MADPTTLREGFERYKSGKSFGRQDMIGMLVGAVEGMDERLLALERVAPAELARRIEALETVIGNALRMNPVASVEINGSEYEFTSDNTVGESRAYGDAMRISTVAKEAAAEWLRSVDLRSMLNAVQTGDVPLPRKRRGPPKGYKRAPKGVVFSGDKQLHAALQDAAQEAA